MPSGDLDMQIRLAAFEFLAEQVQIHGEVLPAKVLRAGFEFRRQPVAVKGIQGIFKPAALPELPLSVTTAPPEPNRPAPYDDGFAADGSLLLYRYRGTDPNHHQNVGLRRAMETRRPLIYFHGVVKGEMDFAAACPSRVGSRCSWRESWASPHSSAWDTGREPGRRGLPGSCSGSLPRARCRPAGFVALVLGRCFLCLATGSLDPGAAL
jgi:putative restriction endonuclease